MSDQFEISTSYISFLEELVSYINSAQQQACRLVNQKLIDVYWYIGKRIIEKQNLEGWDN
ncbi:DUF1016 N-terminal domain-containing protein [Candidatus Uabimicrobium amorphum]|uniref:YhcG N-terminal domain-containing protein n=1 Tax=Uabimicrobium amorphum TaxID=2596890 RepID=A0A5S9IU20_UABAM|nr:DUF1016 N-terminal domain-containing protein [Candidatus Uabimicrobium amorphum]BBM87150.1 hypothetical protein UABAM_05553 [Candidatus Uabimicrobium amorphum]